MTEIIYKNKKELLLACNKRQVRLEKIPYEYREDIEVIGAVMKEWGDQYKDLPPQLKNNRDIALIAVRRWGQALEQVPLKFKSDKEIVKAAIQSNGNNIQYASKKIKDDFDMAYMAVEKNAYAYRFLSNRLKENDKIIRKTIENQAMVFQEMNAKIRKQEKYFKLALNFNSAIYSCGIGDYIHKPEYIKIALNYGKNIFHMPEYIKKNKKIVMSCVANDSEALKFVLPEFQDDKDVVIQALKKHYSAYEYCSHRLKYDEDIFVLGCAHEQALKNAPEKIKKNTRLLIKAIQFGLPVDDLSHAHPDIFEDTDLLWEAAYHNEYAFYRVIPKNIKKELEIMSQAHAGTQRASDLVILLKMTRVKQFLDNQLKKTDNKKSKKIKI